MLPGDGADITSLYSFIPVYTDRIACIDNGAHLIYSALTTITALVSLLRCIMSPEDITSAGEWQFNPYLHCNELTAVANIQYANTFIHSF